MQKIVFTGSLLGATGVILGAFGAHSLKGVITLGQLESFQTAVQYQLIHAIALLFLHSYSVEAKNSLDKWKNVILICWGGGTVCFSGSIYLLILTEAKYLWPITPLGGTLMIIGWISLLILSVKKNK